MADNPLVSILIPVYNRERYIEQCVRSAMAQTYGNIEIIVVDNHSTDNTFSILRELQKEDDRILIYQNEKNLGPVKNWKRCLNYATGEYGKIIWSDDYVDVQFLERTLPFIENPDVGFVFTLTNIFGDSMDAFDAYHIGRTGVYDSQAYINAVIENRDYPVSPGCALFRLHDLKKNLLTKIPNKVHSDFSMHAIGPDLLLFLLTARQYQKFAFVNERLSFFRAHESSITIASSDGKIPIHYALVKAYFLETYMHDRRLIKRLNIYLHQLLSDRSIDTEKYHIDSIENFYTINTDVSRPVSFYLSSIMRKYLAYIKHAIMMKK